MLMQINLFDEYTDFSAKKVLIGLSGGINSMAALCYLAKYYPKKFYPKELYLFYADFLEHSPDTFDFVLSGRDYARKNFNFVKTKISLNSINEYFRQENMIAHPSISPCSINLKILPMQKWFDEMQMDFDLIGYVREESRRWDRQIKKNVKNKLYIISHLSNDDCFKIVKNEIGWYPSLYDLRGDKRKRIFAHNNCLLCKNMDDESLDNTRIFYPDKMEAADETAEITKSYWGRKTTPKEFICDHCLF
jgi:hypothetical protein